MNEFSINQSLNYFEDVSGWSQKQLTSYIDASPLSFVYLFPNKAVERLFGCVEKPIMELTRVDISTLIEFRRLLLSAWRHISTNAVCKYDFTLEMEFEEWLENFDKQYGFTDGLHYFESRKVLLESELEHIRDLPNYDEEYKKKLAEIYGG